MTIYTCAALTSQPHKGYCDQGEERTRATLAKLGIGWDTMVPMRLILDEMGVSDCVFSFCKVKKGCEQEAADTLHKYMQYELGLAMEYARLDPETDYQLKPILKRCQGHMREHLLPAAIEWLGKRKEQEHRPSARHAYNALMCLATVEKDDALAACHAGVALMDAGRAVGVDIEAMLRKKLEELMPKEAA